MTPLVLDCSVTMAWFVEDRANAFADSVLERVRSTGATVPAIWPLEVANVLVVGERRRRSTRAETARIVAFLSDLPINIDAETSRQALGSILQLAREQNLSAYDAAYLELALRAGLPLATLDRDLKRSAHALGAGLI